ncbi:MAG: homocysteine biosynthesis protein [Bacillota bacterium]|nr:homocysteine biosynthesis protein [Bacillota bacterium]
MAVHRTYEEINDKIKSGKVVVVTAEEMVAMGMRDGAAAAAKKVDVVTTATFGPMCSSGAFLNFGHTEPPIRMTRVWLNDVPAYAGIAAVDCYIGATEESETQGQRYGGAHVLQDLVEGRTIRLRATSPGTDCYPRRSHETEVTLAGLRDATLFNPRNCYQNYGAAANTTDSVLYTYMGTLLPRLGNVSYSTSGQLSPMLKDPTYRTIGIGTRVYLGGGEGYVAWEGTQHNPEQERSAGGVPVGGAGTLALIGDLKTMKPGYLRAATFHRYGVTLYVAIGVAIPVLDEDVAAAAARPETELYTAILDYGVPSRNRPALRRVSYAELRSGSVDIDGTEVRTSPVSSYRMARRIAAELKDMIAAGGFSLTRPVRPLRGAATGTGDVPGLAAAAAPGGAI